MERRRRFLLRAFTGFKVGICGGPAGDHLSSSAPDVGNGENKGIDLQEKRDSFNNFIKWPGHWQQSGLLTV